MTRVRIGLDPRLPAAEVATFLADLAKLVDVVMVTIEAELDLETAFFLARSDVAASGSESGTVPDRVHLRPDANG